MRVVRHLVLAVLALALSVASAHASAILIVNGSGILTGATGVNVGGTLYDVEFVDGTCAALFDGCDNAATDFTFTTEADANTAANALESQVFLDGPSGQFDSDPALTLGCTHPFQCEAITPYAVDFGNSLFAREFANFGAGFPVADTVAFFGTFGVSDYDSSSPDNFTVYARWTAVADATVPEPASLTLLGLGLAGIAGRRWRQRKAS